MFLKVSRWGAAMVAVALALSGNLLSAGEFNSVLSIGDVAPTWKELPGVDGKKHSLSDLKGREIIVVVFTCNTCPYAVDYEDRLIAFADEHCGASSKIGLVAINVNTVEDDLLPAMKVRARDKKFPFTYLFDESQQIARDYGAITTPELFVLNRDRKVVYMGAMDDNANPQKVTRRFVEEAVLATVEGRAVEEKETVAVGCLIRFERKRRTKR